LDAEFSEKEIRDAVLGSYAEGAPGPDGFYFLFINTSGSLVKMILWLWLLIGIKAI
jgi:hypothetical protein